MKRTLSLLLCLLTVAAAFASCGESAAQPEVTTAASGETEAAAAETEWTDPFADFDYDGAEIHMMIQDCDYDKHGYTAFFINNEEETGDLVEDAVYERNRMAEELLNVDLTFSTNTDTHDTIGNTVTKLIMAGDDEYQIIVHDLYPMATLSVSGNFMNARRSPYLDFSQDYWYLDYMEDLTFGDTSKTFLLAGDYTIDVLRSAHALYVNKTMFESLYGDPSVIYQTVKDMKWTTEQFLKYVVGAYSDLNGDGVMDNDDQIGFGHVGYWGSMMPWAVSLNVDFIDNDGDGPYFVENNEHSVAVLEQMNRVFYSEATHDYNDVDLNQQKFIDGKTLFTGYLRVCTLDFLRTMVDDAGVIPYPMFNEAQDAYYTSSHDTAGVAVIPITNTKFDMTTAALEVLCRESNNLIIPAYYETALKVKYSRDDDASIMLDIIRDGISSVFGVAYGNYCANLPLNLSFYSALAAKSTDFSSYWDANASAAEAKLAELWDNFSAIEP